MSDKLKKEYATTLPEQADAEKPVPFAVVEAYKTIRTNLQFLLSQNAKKAIVISSALQSEGKSSTAYNCAVAFSQLGHKVILIDADLRKPSIHKKMKLDNSSGLSSALVKFCPLEEAIHHKNAYLDIMTSGPIPPNPSELLGSTAMSDLLATLREKYEYIIIDTPPINVVSDALVLAPQTSGVALVVKDGYCTHDHLKKVLSAIEFANVRLLGFILNATGNGSSSYKSRYSYRRYRYRYNYGYSYSYGYTPKDKK